MTSLLPTTRLVTCPACRELTRLEEAACPHCGAALRSAEGRRLAAAALALGIAVSGCAEDPKDPTTGSEVAGLYGTPTTMDTDTTGMTDTAASSTSGFEVTGLYGTPTTATETDPTPGSTGATGTDATGTATDATGSGTSGVLEPEAAKPAAG